MGSQYIESMTLCLVCQKWQSHSLCEDCITTFAQPALRCRPCALKLKSVPLSQPLGQYAEPICPTCLSHPPVLDLCIAAVDYAYPWSDCITRLKFGEDVGLARALSRLMRHTPWAEAALEQADCVVPMPLSPSRLRERGFNQALELARHLHPDRIDLSSLHRLDTEAHQVGADRAQRLHQVQNSFWLSPDNTHRLKGQRVVLIDDVMTTGATLYAAAETLRRAGVAQVSALVFARTPEREPVLA